MTYNLRRDVIRKIDQLPLGYFDRRTHGEVLSRVTNDVDTISQTLNQTAVQLITSVTTIVGILIMMLSISWQLTIVALLVLPTSMLFVRLIIGRSQGYFVQQQMSLGELNGHVEEMFSGHTVMKAFGGESALCRHIPGDRPAPVHQRLEIAVPLRSADADHDVRRQPRLRRRGRSGWLARYSGAVNIGDIQAFIQYMNQFTQPISQTANIANVLQSTAAAAERVFDFLDEEEEHPTPRQPISLPRVKGAVEFEDVGFGYLPRSDDRMTSRRRSRQGSGSPSSVRPAPARRPWSIC